MRGYLTIFREKVIINNNFVRCDKIFKKKEKAQGVKRDSKKENKSRDFKKNVT